MESPKKFIEDYISNLTKTTIDKSQPLWDLHLLKRLEFSGDGISLMSLLLACTRQISYPSALPTIQCGNHKRRYDSWMTKEPGSNEFISALAAGMKAKLIVEVAYGVSPSTVALAAAARQTGGRLVCILPEPVPAESKKVIKDSGLKDIVDFKTGDPSKLLPNYEKIDFSLVDCKNDEYTGLLKLIDVNPRRSVVVANNLVGEKKGLGGHVRCLNDEVVVRSMKHPIGKGMEVTMIGKSNDIEKRDWGSRESSSPPKIRENAMKKTISSNWIVKVDEKSGEEHIYRVPNFI